MLVALMPSLFYLLLLLLLKLLLSLRNLRAPLISVEEYVCERNSVCVCVRARICVCVCVYLSMRDVKSEKYPRILT